MKARRPRSGHHDHVTRLIELRKPTGVYVHDETRKVETDAFSATPKINYVELPVLARFEILASGNVKPFVR